MIQRLIPCLFIAGLLYGCSESVEPESATTNPVVDQAAPPGLEQREWDLGNLFESSEHWNRAYDAVMLDIQQLPDYRGTLGDSVDELGAALDHMSATYREVLRVYTYAMLRYDENQQVSENQERFSQAQGMFVAYGESISWVAPEIISLGEETVARFLETSNESEPFDFFLENLLREADHTLSDDAEAVLAALSRVTGSPSDIYELLVNADIPWPTLTLSDGEEVFLNQAGYSWSRGVSSREDRIRIFNTFWSIWQDYRDSIGRILATEVYANVAEAKLRGYDSTLQMQLAQENIPTQVYDTLVEEVNAGLPTLHRYFLLRGEMLGVDQMHYYDIYPPLVELDFDFSLETSRDITLQALKPLGPAYTGPMEAVANSPWIHAYPQPGKRSGAYMMGAAYDVNPYVLLNHNGDFSSMSTYAHELGHAVHTILTNNYQPFQKSDYSTFVAEIASQINEILLEEYMIANAETDEERLFYLGYALESMRGSFYRQTMFSEFEDAIHRAVESDQPLSGDRMNEIYGDLLKRYHGHDQGVLEIDDTYAVEWAYIPHFYRDFYVYQYSTSIAGAAWFAEQLLAGNEQVQQDFIELLQAGGSNYPYDLLKDAGLDMAQPEPYRAAVRRMDSIMDRMESILANMD
mgnify:CR=1 FL=1